MTTARFTVRWNFSGLSLKPGAITVSTSSGIASSMAMVIAVSTVNRTPNTSSEKRRAPLMPFASISLAKSGTKAVLKAPSANSRRKVLGNWKAALKASAIGPVPSAAAISISRPKPRARLISVPEATVANFLTRLMRLETACGIGTKRRRRSLGGRLGLAALGGCALEHRYQPVVDGRRARRAVDLLAGEVGDVECVDHLFAKSGDMRRGDVE